MVEVFNIAERRPHVTGEASCIGCKAKWVATAPVGVTELQCGECGTMKGRFVNSVLRKDFLHFICNCGNDLFHKTPHGEYCPNCGSWAVDA